MTAHAWRATALFGPGPRRPLTRDQRRLITEQLRTARRNRQITALHQAIALELLLLLGPDGRCDPSQATLAQRVGCCERTVSTALRRLRNLGLLSWVQRLVRVGRQVSQTSNAYVFRPETVLAAVVRCARKTYTEGLQPILTLAPTLTLTPERPGALAALRKIAQERVAALWVRPRRDAVARAAAHPGRRDAP